MRVLLVQLEIQYLQKHLNISPEDKDAKLRFERLKVEFEDMAQRAVLAD